MIMSKTGLVFNYRLKYSLRTDYDYQQTWLQIKKVYFIRANKTQLRFSVSRFLLEMIVRILSLVFFYSIQLGFPFGKSIAKIIPKLIRKI